VSDGAGRGTVACQSGEPPNEIRQGRQVENSPGSGASVDEFPTAEIIITRIMALAPSEPKAQPRLEKEIMTMSPGVSRPQQL
jgi:hypothetical protein